MKVKHLERHLERFRTKNDVFYLANVYNMTLILSDTLQSNASFSLSF